ncbi:hypothetical protein MPER_09242, partial [Moniliophthora perniciosa FA553]
LRSIFYERRRKNAENGAEQAGDGEEESEQSGKDDSEEKVTTKKRKSEEVTNAQRQATKRLSTSTAIEAHSRKPATRMKRPEESGRVGAHRRSTSRMVERKTNGSSDQASDQFRSTESCLTYRDFTDQPNFLYRTKDRQINEKGHCFEPKSIQHRT